MSYLKTNSVAVAAALVASTLCAHHLKAGTYQTITVDGNTSEWSTVPVAVTAPVNSAAPIDLTQLKMANDANYIYFELTYYGTPNPQSGSGVFLGIDSDNSAATGFNIYGSTSIGANFAYQNDYPFTQAAGVFNSGGTFSNYTYAASPYNTNTSTQEIAIPRTLSETDSSAGGYTGNVFNSSFTVEFYTTESTVSVLGPYTYTIAAPPSQATYTQTGSGDYNYTGNWSAAIPNAVDAEADFLGAITANHTVYSDTDITLGKIVFNNANTYVLAGAGTLTIASSSGSGLIDAQAGTQKITLPTTIESNTILNADSGATLIMGGPLTINPGVSLTEAGAGTVLFQSSITVEPGGSVALAANSHAAALSLIGASTASLVAQTGTTKTAMEVDSLSLSSGSTFDIKNGDLIVQNGSLSSISQSAASGYNANGAIWAGTGITSSTAANDSNHLTAVGVIQNSVAGNALYSSFGGLSVGVGDVLVKYTYYGDTNLDGTVDGGDYSRIDNSALTEQTTNTAISGWFNGDFNYDGVVNGSDYTLIDNAFNTQGAALSSEISSPTVQIAAQIAPVSAVPEPASVGMLALGSALLLGRRSKKS